MLRLASFHQRQHRYHQQIHFIPWIHNTMADTTSRSFHLSDSDFLTHFNSHFPQPTSWTLHHLRPETLSSLISALCKRPSPLATQPSAPVLPPWLGNSGSLFAHPSTSTLSFHPSKIKFPSYKYLPTVTDTASSPPPNDRSGLAQWKMLCVRLRRHTPAWGPQTLV